MNKESLFTKLYEREADAVFRFALLKTSDREVAKDIVQETFLRLWGELSGGEVRSEKALLWRITRNLVIDWYRKKKSVSLDKMQEESETGEIYLEGLRFDQTIEAEAEGRMLLERINKLTSAYRDIIYLRFVEGLGPKEIAEMMGENPNSVSVKINRAVKSLREEWKYDK